MRLKMTVILPMTQKNRPVTPDGPGEPKGKDDSTEGGTTGSDGDEPTDSGNIDG